MVNFLVMFLQPLINCLCQYLVLEMMCEPSHLKRLNSRATIEELMKSLSLSSPGVVADDSSLCAVIETKDDIFFPAFEPSTRHCYLQKDSLLFSCVGEVDGLVRLCSCRDYIRGQTALCSRCP